MNNQLHPIFQQLLKPVDPDEQWKREAEELTHKMATEGLTFSQSTRRLRLQRAADLAAEQTPEGRDMAHHYRTNFHE